MSKPGPEGRERAGNVPISALLNRARRDLRRALVGFGRGDNKEAAEWVKQALAILEGKGTW